jgi:hypothetical protein
MTNDIDELTALNLDFVASAQNSDVRRFDEILAPDPTNRWSIAPPPKGRRQNHNALPWCPVNVN